MMVMSTDKQKLRSEDQQLPLWVSCIVMLQEILYSTLDGDHEGTELLVSASVLLVTFLISNLSLAFFQGNLSCCLLK